MSDPHPGLSPNTGESLPPASHIERLELAIVDYLKPHLPNDVTVMAQVDDPDHFDISNCDRVVMVHFAQNTPIGHRDRLAGTTGFDYASMEISADVAEQADQTFRNIDAALREAGAAMADVVRAQGGTILQDAEVDEIRVVNGAARGVTLTDGVKLDAPLVVSNADAGHTYAHLLRNHPRRRWTGPKLKRKRWSMGLYVWYFGTKGTKGMWPDLGHHTIANGPRFKGLLRDIFMRGKLADDMSLYVHRPSLTDPSVAPEGDDTFYVLSPVPHLGWKDAVDWQKEEPIYREKVAAELEKMMPGFREKISTETVFTPETFRDRYLSPHGAGFSLEPRILQSAWFRPHNVSEEAKGLFLVGAGTHPGAGLPGVGSSAEVRGKLVPDLNQGVPQRAAEQRLAAE